VTKEEFYKFIRIPKNYIENFLMIHTKNGKVSKLVMKPAQERLYEIIQKERKEGRPVRIIILKARQLGFSTLIEGLFFQDAATKRNVRTMIVAHDDESTTALFRMNKFFYENLPAPLKPMLKASNAKELIFENPTRDANEKTNNPGLMSMIKCVPATGSSVGRGSTLTHVHLSECAFWRNMNETLEALLPAVPSEPETSVILETTPNGYNAFKKMWDDAVEGKIGFMPLFFPWYEEPGYRMEVPPGTEWTKEELSMKETYHLDDNQLSWRRWCIANTMHGDDEKFKQEYPSCPEEAFLRSGNPYFKVEVIIERINQIKEKPVRGRYIYSEGPGGIPENWAFQEDDEGEIYIYEKPKERFPYVIAGDTAGDGSDRFTGFLIDNSTGRQTAMVIYDGGSELYYAQQMYCLGKDYNGALVGIEINFSTYPEKKLEEWQYPKLYIRERPDDSRGELETYKLGWRTDQRTRPLILANLQAILRDNSELIESVEMLRECLTFIRNEDMRPEAAEGEHDDCVMAAAICFYIRGQQDYLEQEIPEEKKVKFIDTIRRRNGHH